MRKYLIKVTGNARQIYDYLINVLKCNIPFNYHENIEYYTYNEGVVGFLRPGHDKIARDLLSNDFIMFNDIEELNQYLHPPKDVKKLIFTIEPVNKNNISFEVVRQKTREVLAYLGYKDNVDNYPMTSEGWCYEIDEYGIKLVFHKNHEQAKIISKTHKIYSNIFELYEDLPKGDPFFFI